MKLFTQSPQPCGRRLAQKFAVALCVFFLAAVPALADGVRIGQVVQTQTNSQAKPELRLSSVVSQDPVAPGTKGSTQNGPANGAQDGQKSNQSGLSSAAAPGVTITNEGATIGVDIIEEGEVEGTICDCGEVFVAGTPFPKWPFLLFSAVPVVFISKCCDEGEPQSSPTPTPTPTPPSTPTPTPPAEVPEPASLLLFGTGLAAAGAAVRRRYAKAKHKKKEEE